jgi:Golgi phosphoprotein 3 (GPP34)
MPPPALPLTDDLWLASHDNFNGKALLTGRTLGIGLGAGLLAELLFQGYLVLSQGRLYVQPAPPPQDPALTPVADQFREEERGQRLSRSAHELPGHDVREWIAYLAVDDRAHDLVTNRLSQSGIVAREERRKLGRKRVVFVPRDSTISGWPASRISNAIARREALSHPDLVLAGLFLATGLHQQVLDRLTTADLRDLAQQLKARMHPMLRELVHHAEAAVGEAVMTR